MKTSAIFRRIETERVVSDDNHCPHGLTAGTGVLCSHLRGPGKDLGPFGLLAEPGGLDVGTLWAGTVGALATVVAAEACVSLLYRVFLVTSFIRRFEANPST
ncbi:hypothetical protein SBV1_410063 [Verrucomicrobia bacterium]|nr:hypothetical protein SBV1_410063 [Verrucomicrobiota bacterium]